MDILKDILGMNVTYAQWNKTKALPFYLAAGYDFQKAEIDGCFCILAFPKTDLPTLPALKKQIHRIQEAEALPVVICLQSMSAFRRKSMIENRIPFILEEKQAYLPFMGTYLQSKADMDMRMPEKFMVSSQVLFLWYMYQEAEELYLADAVKELPYSAMTVTRAAKQLEESGLFGVRKEGVNKILFGKHLKKELYGRGKEYLCSPVVQSGFLDKEKVTKDMVIAGASALAEKTMLNKEALQEYAVDKKKFDSRQLRNELVDNTKQVKIEVWKYAPQLFGKGGMADVISVALSFMEEKDERIEIAVGEMLDEFWEK